MLDLPDIPWVALDTETSGLHPDDGARVACVALAHQHEDGRVWSVGLPFDQGVLDKIPNAQLGLNLFTQVDNPNLPEEAWQELFDWLLDRLVVYHNAKFDMTMMRAGTRHWQGRDLLSCFHWDTMMAQRVLDPIERVGLDVTCKRLGLGGKEGLDAVKQWLKANKYPTHRYDLVPWEVIEQYVVTDTEQTAMLYVHQQNRLAEGPVDVSNNGTTELDRIEREFDLTRALYLMELRGIGFDAQRSLEAAAFLEREAARIGRTMPFAAVPKAAHQYFFVEQGLLPDRRSDKTGKPSMDAQQLRDWANQGVQWAKEYKDVTTMRRAVSMWYRGYPEKMGTDGRLRTVYRQAQVKSGRMSVERVQLQAMPKSDKGFEGLPEVRELMIPRPGYKVWHMDLSQAELRVASQYSQCDRMLGFLLSGSDQHGATCEEVILRREGLTKADLSEKEWKVKRDIAKRLNFSGIFQIGPDHFQYILAKMADLHLDLDECRDIIYGWRNMYPEFGEYYRRADRMAATKGYVRLLPNTRYEERSYFGPRDWTNTAWNRIVQGSLALFFKMWMVEIEKRWPGYMILTVHDSVDLEAPPDEGDQIAAEVAAWGAEAASELFGIQMKVDID